MIRRYLLQTEFFEQWRGNCYNQATLEGLFEESDSNTLSPCVSMNDFTKSRNGYFGSRPRRITDSDEEDVVNGFK